MGISQLSVSIVIPNWNGAALLAKHLPKVIEAAPKAEIIVVDDHSTDNSVSFLQSRFPKVKTIVKEVNSGFAETVNIGVARARGDIVVLINSDVVPERGFLTPIFKHFQHPEVFGVGCLEKNPEKGGVVLRGRGIASWQKGFYIHARGEIDGNDTAWVAGGSGAFQRKIWRTLGGLDMIFNPFYWEDIDLSYRARKAGYRVVFEPKSAVWHYHEQGAIKTQFQQNRINRIAFRNQFIFIWKNLTDTGLWFEHLFWTPLRIMQELLRGNTNMLTGFVMALGQITHILVIRRKYRSLWKKQDRQIETY